MVSQAMAGAISGQAGRATGNLVAGRPIEEGLFNLPELALDAASAGLIHYVSGGSFGSAIERGGAGTSGVCSFSADTLVATEQGEKAIGTLAVGEKVLAYDEASGTTGNYAVQAVLINNDPVEVFVTIEGEKVETTPEHPWYTQDKGWVNAGELSIGELIRKANGSYGHVQALEFVRKPKAMYNLTVEKAHTFFVGEKKWLVHNHCGQQHSLLPNEGQVGSYKYLSNAKNGVGRKGDDLTAHHIPSDSYMQSRNVAGYTKNDGISIMMEQSTVGGRHRETLTYGAGSDLSLTPRQTLAKEIWDARSIYMADGLYGDYIRQQLKEVIRQNKSKWTGFFDKAL